MIIPLVSKTEWAISLEPIETWQPDDSPMLIVVPHPDDETLALGGLIAVQRSRGVDVTIIAVTDGEHAYSENEGLAGIRREEQRHALSRLGVPPHKIIRLGIVDSSIAAQEAELVTQLRRFVTSEMHVVAPWLGDFHPDHEACAHAAAIVARDVGATLISYFFWTWHRGTVATIEGLHLRKFVLTEEAQQAKREALECHVSQLKHSPEPEILTENLLWPARMPFEVFAL